MSRDWESVVRADDFSNVMKLVHLAMRQTDADVEQIRGELLKRRVTVYENELSLQAQRVGCPGRRGRLTKGPSLTQLNDESRADAEGIVNTYNYDLAIAIKHIRTESPRANRYVYAERLKTWEDARAKWKREQIARYTEGTARALAQSDFYRFNRVEGYAVLEPTSAVCPVCQGWVARGNVPLNVAEKHPPPYHVGCPHLWRTYPGQVPKDECRVLWMGD